MIFIFSLKFLVGVIFVLKVLLNSRSSLFLVFDDVMIYMLFFGWWYLYFLKNEGENIKEYNCFLNVYVSYINNL